MLLNNYLLTNVMFTKTFCDVVTTEDGTVRKRYNFDPCIVRRSTAKVEGRRRNPTDWSYSGVTLPTYTNRGFTGHEHLDNFSLIYMNGRVSFKVP